MLLIAGRGREQCQAQHELRTGQRPHAAEHAEYFAVRGHAGRSRFAAWITVSKAFRKRERSCFVNGGGPPVLKPISRRWRETSRPARALPILSADQILPAGAIARAPFSRQRDARGMSAVTHTSPMAMCSAIQSSAASAVSPTVIIVTFARPVGRIGRDPLATTTTGRASRSATR